MRVSHLILDTYDLLQSPEMRDKVASKGLDATKLASLPDRLFALVAENDGETIRKYAMHDELNTRASIDALLEYGVVLPEAVQKTAAENLVMACGWYGLDVPEKLAARAEDQPPGSDVVARAMKIGTKSYRSGGQDWPESAKTAELNGTELMPMSGQPKTTPVTKKQGIVAANTTKHAGDITDFNPTVPAPVYEPQVFALQSERRYPLDIPDHVIKAAAYFDEWMPKMDPAQRREFARNTAIAAEDFALPISEKLAAYAGDEIGDRFDAGIQQRIDRADEAFAPRYLHLQKVAHSGAPPSAVAQALAGLDKASGLEDSYGRPGVGVEDAYRTTFGMKTASPYYWAMEQSSVDEPGLRALAESGKAKLAGAFGPDFAESFAEDPVAIFESMPDPQKVAIANLAAAV